MIDTAYHSHLTNSFFPRDQIEEIPVVGDAADSSAPPVVEIDAHGGVVDYHQLLPTTTNQQPRPTNNHHPPTTPVGEIDAHGGVVSCLISNNYQQPPLTNYQLPPVVGTDARGGV